MPSLEELQAAIVERASKDSEFRARLMTDPTAAIAEATGVALPANLELTVLEESPSSLYLVLPSTAPRPAELSDSELEKVSGGVYTQCPCGQTTQEGDCSSAAGTGNIVWT